MIDCFSAPELMPFSVAKEILLDKVTPVEGVETIDIQRCAKRVNATEIRSPINVPAHNNSAMDGYAFNADFSTLEDLEQTYQLIGTSKAGRPFSGVILPGQCIRIMTGAVVPDSANAIEMQENVNVKNGYVELSQSLKLNNHIRLAGEDIKKDQLLFSAGHQFSAPDIGLLASLGISKTTVKRKLRVAVFSTGDELKSADQALGLGDIYESNRHVLITMLNNMHVDVLDFGIVPDNFDKIKQAFNQANQQADVVISSGGASVGDADFTKDVLEELGQIEFWKVAIKPGKPLAFGHLSDSVFFGLPGNPVSATVTFHVLAMPALIKMMGSNYVEPLMLPAKTTQVVKKRPGRMDFQRGIAKVDESGKLAVTPILAQGSGILSSMSKANCYIVLPQEHQGCDAGSDVNIQLFDHIIRC